MNQGVKKFLIIAAIMAVSMSLGWELGHRDITLRWQNYNPKINVQNIEPPKNINVDFSQFWDTWDLVSQEYIDKSKLDPQKMVYGAISGMVRSLDDPYTIFLTPEQNKDFNDNMDGSFEGVGIELGYKKGKLVVVAPLKNTPAEKEGVKAGDWIIQIDDKETTDMTTPEAVSLIRGKTGTAVKLTLLHEGEKDPVVKTLTRDVIKIKSVEVSIRDDKIANVRINRFSEQTPSEWDNAVSEILKSNAKGIILDLRGNPGGTVVSSIYVASDFLSPNSIVVKEQKANGEILQTKTTDNHRLQQIPTVVLIDKGSASAAEILAGALLDNKRAKLVGEISFGKGSVQEVKDLPSNSAVHVTFAKWLLPSGASIEKVGLKPDFEVKLTKDDFDNNKDPQLDKALSLLK